MSENYAGWNVNLLYPCILPGLGCFLITVLLVPLSIKVAPYIGALDQPGRIKIHTKPIPRFGGGAIFLSFFLIYLIFPSVINQLHISVKIMISFSMLGTFLVGILDDILDLNPYIKLMIQIFTISIAVIGLFMLYNSVQLIYFIIIFFFILGYTNAFNLIDGMDGLASGIAIFVGLSLFAISFFMKTGSGPQEITILSATLIMGTSLGFLIFNLNPAKIFLGDCGSTFLGFLIALIISLVWLNSSNKFVLFPLLIIAGIPIFDTLSAIWRRIKLQKPIFQGDRSHLYDRLLQNGYSVKQTLIIFYSISLLLSISGIYLFFLIEH